MDVYVALNSVPDYHAPAPSFKSVHRTLDGAILAVYPKAENERFRKMFRKWPNADVWEGPDGFGMVKLVQLQD